MPVAVKPEEVPTFVRAGTVSKYPEILNYATAWLRDPKRATKEAVAFTQEDGITKENWGVIASALRRVAKDLKVKLAIVFREDEMRLYVKHNGDFIPLTAEEIKKRTAKRRENKINVLTEKYVGEGMTEPNARKRAQGEVDKLPVV